MSTKPKQTSSSQRREKQTTRSPKSGNVNFTPAKKQINFSLRQIVPLTDRQEDMFVAFENNKHIIGYGSSGTGKTMVCVYLALRDVLINKTHDRIIIVRSPLSVNSQGHLPGTLEEKEAVFERPYKDIVNWLMDDNLAYETLKENDIISFQTTSYIRGLTWEYSIVIADETQNMLWEEINTIATRKGVETLLMFIGDLKQDDLSIAKRNHFTGMNRLLMVGQFIQDVEMINFLPEDIVRDKFVKEWILACEKVEQLK